VLLGAPFAAFAGLDWRVQLAVVAVLVGSACYGIYARDRIRRVCRDFNAQADARTRTA
jgi:hypothetical protein